MAAHWMPGERYGEAETRQESEEIVFLKERLWMDSEGIRFWPCRLSSTEGVNRSSPNFLPKAGPS